jgi:RHS repeat-associated protein
LSIAKSRSLAGTQEIQNKRTAENEGENFFLCKKRIAYFYASHRNTALNNQTNTHREKGDPGFFFGSVIGETREKRAELNFYYVKGNHLGSVLVTVSDRKIPIDLGSNGSIDYYTADVVSATDMYSGGMAMPGRSFNSTSYRFGYGGHEKDDEISGSGNAYDFEGYGYDPRTNRRKSRDPLTSRFPSESPYAYAGNSPITIVDQDGKKKTYYLTIIDKDGKSTKLTIVNKYQVQEVNRHVDNTGGTPAYYSNGKPVIETKYYDTEQSAVLDQRTGKLAMGEEKQKDERSGSSIVRGLEDNFEQLDNAATGDGGIMFTSSKDWGGNETRKGGANADAQSVNIDLLLDAIGSAKSAATSKKAGTLLEKFKQAFTAIKEAQKVDKNIITPAENALKQGPIKEKIDSCTFCGQTGTGLKTFEQGGTHEEIVPAKGSGKKQE